MGPRKSVRKPWSKEEDSSLLLFIAKHGTHGFWPQIATMMDDRTGKQCRERYINHLDPDMKRTPWTKQEDNVIRDLFPSIGSKWSQYIEYLPGRSDNAIKNRYHVISRYNFNSSNSTLSGHKKSCPEVTSCESDDQDDDIESSLGPQLKRLKRLHTARELLDQRIRELEDTTTFVTSHDSDDLSTTFCEEALMSELGSDFEDFDFLWDETDIILPKRVESSNGLNFGFDFDGEDVKIEPIA